MRLAAVKTANDNPEHVLRESNFLKYLNVKNLDQINKESKTKSKANEWISE